MRRVARRFAGLHAVSAPFLPFYALYRLGWWGNYAWRAFRRNSVSLPPAKIISVGNVEWGGTGKTELVMEIAGYLGRKGRRVTVVSRGYRRTGKGPSRVNPADPMGWEWWGDEPMMIARSVAGVRVWVGPDRAATIRAAHSQDPADVYVLDDGLHLAHIRKDLDIVTGTAEDWPRLAGALRGLYLRAPFSLVKMCEATVLISSPLGMAPSTSASHLGGSPTTFGVSYTLAGWKNVRTSEPVSEKEVGRAPVYAFSGIARPDRFSDLLRKAGITVAGEACFPDHHSFSSEDVAGLEKEAESVGAGVFVTTAKDAIRLAGRLSGAGRNVLMAEVRLAWQGGRSGFERIIDGLWR